MVETVQPVSDARETSRLISSDKVSGTNVENTRGTNLGHIQAVMIDKISGRVGYAVLKYGSFLGMGGKLFALPWETLKYDTRRDAYIVGIPEDRLKNAPSFDSASWPEMGDPAFGKSIHDYYGSSADWYL
ncbi:MAG TPA: PRC-barrel domain-containing protein [Stellaceae bacterium]|nr:PRC-barrel domain-containing protein [Stellaceae bacterium]